uniref:DUF1700 domain-containing protein n=1 Tax=Dialister sp. TaxID=1955814 RepID=UPI0040256EAA
MNKTEFLDLLRYYFRNAKKSEVEEILADYEAHFEEGKKRGLTEEAIAKELGSPKDIYESYASEGVVDEKSKSVRFTDDAKEAAQEAWDEVSPKLPAAAERAAHLTSRLLYGTSLLLAIILICATLLVLALISIEFAPLPGVMPLPGLHLMTKLSIGVAGVSSALAVFLIGREGSRALQGSFSKEEKGGEEK